MSANDETKLDKNKLDYFPKNMCNKTPEVKFEIKERPDPETIPRLKRFIIEHFHSMLC